MLISWLMILIVSHASANGGGAQWPDHCIKNKTYPCVLYVHSKTYFSSDENQFYFSKDSLVEWSGKDQMFYYKGIAWLKFAKEASVQLPFGNFQASPNSEVVIDLKDNQLVVRVLSGKVRVTGRADRNAYELSEGTEIELGPVDYVRKVASVSLPRAISMHAYVKTIQQAFPFSDLNFQEHVERVGRSIRSGLQLYSQWNQTIVETKLSDARREKVRQKYEAEYAERRDSLLRRIYRQKNNFEE